MIARCLMILTEAQSKLLPNPPKTTSIFFSISANLFALKWIFLMTFAHLLLQKLFVGLQQTNISFKDVNTMKSFESFHSKNRAVVYICEHWLTLNNYLYMESLDSFHCKREQWCGWFMVFNTTFNNISVISWQSVLLVSQITDKLYHINVVSSTPCHVYICEDWLTLHNFLYMAISKILFQM